MTSADAAELLSAIRRAGDELMKGLAELRQRNPGDLRKWEMAVATAMGKIQDHLLEPLLAEFPEISKAAGAWWTSNKTQVIQ